MLAIALSVAASIAWGAGDFGGGVLSRRLHVFTVVFFSQLAALVVSLALLAASGESFPSFGELAPAGLAGIAGIGGLCALFYGLSIGRVSIVAPLTALSVAVPVLADLFAGNVPSTLQAAGMVVAFLGVVLASLEPGESERETPWLAVGMGLLAALGFGVFFVAMDSAVDAGYFWALTTERFIATLALGVAVLVAGAPRNASGDLLKMSAIGLLDMLAVGLFAYAATKGSIGIVALLSALYPVTTVVLAVTFLHERLHPVQVAGIAAGLTGVALIAVG
ncbi:MAG: DMT family transporter [Thermoleophilaceae bacterium]|nr:DMT family transporter [Thermoleophilaceae bacterium]